MHTELEARTTWCPMVRYEPGKKADSPLINRDLFGGKLKRGNCIANECAMWRWTAKKKTGYCGLGGLG